MKKILIWVLAIVLVLLAGDAAFMVKHNSQNKYVKSLSIIRK